AALGHILTTSTSRAYLACSRGLSSMHIATSYHLSRERHREASGVGDDPWDNKAILKQMVARVFAIELDSICRPTRGRAKVAMARQVAMYLAHVVCGLNLTEAGELFGRDRTTAAHACRVVERRREDHPDFDRALRLLENLTRVLTYGPL